MARNTTLLPMYLESKGDTRRGPRDELLQSLMQQQAHAGVGTPVYSIPQGIARTGNMMMLSLMNKWEKDEEKAKHKKAGDTLFSSLGAMLGGGAPKADAGAVNLAKALKGESFADKVVNVESGGDPYAKNPRSTATGPGQFIESTWIDQINKIKPELAAGKTREEVLQLRTDPGLSREMTEAYGNENARILSERGVPVNEATKYLAHFAGPGGAVAIMTSAPETPAAQLLGRHVVEANPFLENMTAKDIQGWATRKMGGAGEARVEPAAPPPQAMPQQQVASLDPNFLPREAQTRPAPQNAPPAPQAAQLAPGQPQQPYAPQQAPQGQQEASQPLGGFMQPEEMQMLRTLYDSGEMSAGQIAGYVQSKRNEYLESQKAQWEYKDGQWYRIGADGPQPFGEPNQAAESQSNEFGLTPMFVQDAEGNVIPTQLSKRGGAQPVQMPEGYSVPSGVEKIDLGTQFALQDKRTGNIVGYLPKDVEGEAAAKEIGTQRGEAQMALPGALQKAEQAINIIDQLIEHPGRETATGLSGMVDPRNYLPGTEATDFHVMKRQLQGKAFLEAFESLKGGGVITEVEGMKATEALARLDTAQSDEAYEAALREFRSVIKIGTERARQRAGQEPQQQAPDVAPTGQPNTTSTGVPWRIVE
jgi:nitrous oxide reductase accessory protein NosL